MAQPQFGKTNFKRAIKEVRGDLELMERLLERLLENNVTATEHARLIAQLTLVGSRIGRYIGDIEKMGNQLPEETGIETLTQQK